jgi:hypothetical protein
LALWVDNETAGSNYVVLLNGDAIEGDHHGTKQVWSKDTQDHVEAAHVVLAPLMRRASALFIVRGTECHTNNAEVTLGKILRAQINPDTGLPAFDRLHLTIRGCRCGDHGGMAGRGCAGVGEVWKQADRRRLADGH